MDIGTAFLEVNHYDTNWIISQQHDKVEVIPPAAGAPKPARGTHVFKAVFTTAQGPAIIEETVSVKDRAVHYVMTFKSDKEILSRTLAATFLLPTAVFAGKTMKVDDTSFVLPEAARPHGDPAVGWKKEAHRVEIPTPDGTLIITGTFPFYIQDDRQWNDPRYSMRLGFTPESGAIKESMVDLVLKIERPKKTAR
jgi:hypothetical protein